MSLIFTVSLVFTFTIPPVKWISLCTYTFIASVVLPFSVFFSFPVYLLAFLLSAVATVS
jgi:hypothetical protein